MIIIKGAPFLLPAGWKWKAQLAGKKRTPFSKDKNFNGDYYFDFHIL